MQSFSAVDTKSITFRLQLIVCIHRRVVSVCFQATLHGYVLSNETVDPIIPQLINAVRNHKILKPFAF